MTWPVLYGCETWALTLRQEQRLRMSQNKVPSLLHSPVTGEWRRLHKEGLYYLYSSPNIIRVFKSSIIRWAGYVERVGDRRGACRALVGKPEGKSQLEVLGIGGRILLKLFLQKVEWGGMDWIRMAWERDRWRAFVNAVMNLRVPYIAVNFLTSWEPVSFWGRTLLHGVSQWISKLMC